MRLRGLLIIALMSLAMPGRPEGQALSGNAADRSWQSSGRRGARAERARADFTLMESGNSYMGLYFIRNLKTWAREIGLELGVGFGGSKCQRK